MSSRYDCIVIGGGPTGLGTAWTLGRLGLRVLLLEQGPELAGLAGSYQLGRARIERFYHHCFRSDRYLLEALRDLGLSDRMEWKPAPTGFFSGGKVHLLNGILEGFQFPILGIWDKWRLLRATCEARDSVAEIEKLDGVTAREWITAHCGERVWLRFFRPLISAKFGEDCDSVSAAWIVNRMGTRSDRGNKGERLGYPQNGFAEILERLSDEVRRLSTIRTGAGVGRILIRNGRVEGVESAAGLFSSPAVVSTVSPQALLGMAELPPKDAARVARIRFQGVVCALFGLKRPLQNAYWLNIAEPSLPFGLLVEHTNFHDVPEYDGVKLLYAATYLDPRGAPLWGRDDAAVARVYMDALERRFGLDPSDVLWWRVSRAAAAGPVYRTGFWSSRPPIRGEVGGLFLGGMMSQYPDRGLSQSLGQSQELAQAVRESLEPARV